MNRRLLLLSLFCTVVTSASLAASGTAGAASTAEPAVSANPRLSVIGRAPDFTLRDANGEPVSLSKYRGRIVLLAFVFTTCHGVCPLISQQMGGLQQALKQEGLFGVKAVMLSVTVDPQHDTATVLSKYAKTVGADPTGWRFLREAPSKLEPVLQTYNEWTKLLPKGELDHPARLYLIDQAGNMREIYSLAFFNEKQTLFDMKALLRESASGKP
jgi:protein SCO1/2